MAREFEGYRETLARIDTAYPQEVLRTRDVCQITGLCKATVLKRVPLRRGYISKEALARWICKEFG